MPSKLFMTNKLSEYADNSLHGGLWDTFPSDKMNFTIDTNKYGDPFSILNTVSVLIPASQQPNVWSAGCYRGISRRLAPQTISGTINALIFAKEVGTISGFTRLHAYILDTTGGDNTGTVFAVLRTFEDSQLPASPWSYSSILAVQWGGPCFIFPATIPDDGRDYRLVVEMGCVTHRSNLIDPVTNLPSTQMVMDQQIGARNANLLPLDNTSTPFFGTPYFEFSSDIIFKEYQLPRNHEIEFAEEAGFSPEIPRGTINVIPYKTHPLWYKHTKINLERVLGFQACHSSIRVKASLYMEDGPYVKFLIDTEWNGVANHSVVIDKDIYFKTWPEINTGIPFTLRMNIMDFVPGEVGDLILPPIDNKPNIYDPTIIGLYPTMLRVGAAPGPIRSMSGRFGSTRHAVALYAGRFGMVNEFSKELFIYGRAPLFKLLNRVPTTLISIKAIGTDFISFFIVGGYAGFDNGVPRYMWRIDYHGNFYPRPFVLPVADASSLMGVNRASSVLYYGREIRGETVNRHDLLTDAPMSTFPNAPGSDYIPKYVLVMSDNTIVCLFSHYAGGTHRVHHYSPDGTTLHAHALTTIGNDVIVQYISHIYNDDPDRIWIRYYHYPAKKDWFIQLQLSTGVTAPEFGGDLDLFENGKGPADRPCDASLWGAEINGVMIPIMFTPDVSGIYYLNPLNKHDNLYYAIDVRIPDPTVRTALFGE